MSSAHSPTFHHFTYVTTHSPTLLSLYLCHSSFFNLSDALPTSQFIVQPFFRFSYITSSSLNSPGELPMVPYNMRCWKCCPPSSTHFWRLFRKYAFTQINSISQIQSISCLILAFNSSNVWGFEIFIYGGTWKIKCMQWTPTHYKNWKWVSGMKLTVFQKLN